MMRVVVDASVVAKLFTPADERHVGQAAWLADRIAAGAIAWRAPELLHLEVLNVAARKWMLAEPALLVLAAALADMGIERAPTDTSRVASWAARGLTSYDAAYVAAADAAGVPLVTDDDQVVALASEVAVSLAEFVAAG